MNDRFENERELNYFNLCWFHSWISGILFGAGRTLETRQGEREKVKERLCVGEWVTAREIFNEGEINITPLEIMTTMI